MVVRCCQCARKVVRCCLFDGRYGGIITARINLGARIFDSPVVRCVCTSVSEADQKPSASRRRAARMRCGGYTGKNLARVVRELCNAEVKVIKRSDDSSGFQILPRRWVVERTFSWLVSSRRLCLDYELLPEVSEALIYTAMIRLMLRRLSA